MNNSTQEIDNLELKKMGDSMKIAIMINSNKFLMEHQSCSMTVHKLGRYQINSIDVPTL